MCFFSNHFVYNMKDLLLGYAKFGLKGSILRFNHFEMCRVNSRYVFQSLCNKCLWVTSRILDILILQDKTLFGVLEAGNIVCWLVNQPITKLDLFKSSDCRWFYKTYVEYCYRNSATVRRLVQSPTLQSTIFCGVHSDLRGKGIRVSPAW